MSRAALAARVAAMLLLAASVAALAQPAPRKQKTFPATAGGERHLVIYGSTDIASFAPAILDYQRQNPDTEIVYREAETRDVRGGSAGGDGADLLLSSSMDLQTQFANDGHAQPHQSVNADAVPDWARWRNEAFGFTYEPAVIVYDPRRLAERDVPRTHSQLLAMLRDPRSPLAGRVGTYDLRRSGVGYLLATQDAQLGGSLAGALIAALGDNRVQLEGSTGALLDRIESGELVLGYNLLGGYAQARIDAGRRLKLALLQDYTLVISRIAVIPKKAPHPEQAHRFLDYLLSQQAQTLLARESHLLPARDDVPNPLRSAPGSGLGPLRPIALGPGLLVYLDDLKRKAFLDTWDASVDR